MSFQSTGVHVRIIASILCVIAAALPAWWVLTTIVRLPLPGADVAVFEARGACPIRTAWSIELEQTPYTDACDNTLEDLVQLADMHELCVDWHVGATDEDGRRVCDAGVQRNTTTHSYAVPPWIHLNAIVPEYLTPLFGAVPGAEQREDARVVEYARNVRIVFSLLQEEASEGHTLAGWDLTHALQNVDAHADLAPLAHILKALQRVYDVQLESQVQWYAPLEVAPSMRTIGNDTYAALSMQDVSVFVNSVQWSLDSYGTADMSPATEVRTLQMVLFVPSARHTPMYIDDAQLPESPVQRPAWLLPQWGGVIVWNRDFGNGDGLTLTLGELRDPIEKFAEQLRALLGIDFAHVDRSESALNMSVDGLEWRRTLEMARSAVETLGSIVRLVEKMPNLGVNAQVRDNFLASLDALRACDELHGGDALRTATKAHTHASRAFYDPSMLATLYFPSEHRFAVYTPLFGPILLPILFAIIREWKFLRRAPLKRQPNAQSGGEHKTTPRDA